MGQKSRYVMELSYLYIHLVYSYLVHLQDRYVNWNGHRQKQNIRSVYMQYFENQSILRRSS